MIDQLMDQTFDVVAGSIASLEHEAAVSERLATLGLLSAVIAHELHDPLLVIRASARSLQRRGASLEDVRVSAVDIIRQVARLDRILTDVVDFAQPLRLERSRVDVAALVWDAAGTILGAWEGPHVRMALDPDVGTIVTDNERLRAVLTSLLENAREALRAAGRCDAVEGIELGGRRIQDGRLLLWVADKGAGVAAADLPHVFEPFFTTRRSGTGLGLAIARKVVDALGGAIRIESREAEGTRVEIELPD